MLAFKRPDIHALSFAAFTFGVGAACVFPLFVWELSARPAMTPTWPNMLTIAYVSVFPSVLAYLCFNRGVALVGANRASLVLYLVPMFGSMLAITALGERPTLSHVVGYALVLCGIAIAARNPKRETPASADTPK